MLRTSAVRQSVGDQSELARLLVRSSHRLEDVPRLVDSRRLAGNQVAHLCKPVYRDEIGRKRGGAVLAVGHVRFRGWHDLLSRVGESEEISQQKLIESILWPVLGKRYGDK